MNVKKKLTSKTRLDRAKLCQSRELAKIKMEQNEELAELRADTTLANLELNKCLVLTKINDILS